MLFRARLAAPHTHAPGPESLETRLVRPSEIPWDEIAFSSVSLSLRCARGACRLIALCSAKCRGGANPVHAMVATTS